MGLIHQKTRAQKTKPKLKKKARTANPECLKNQGERALKGELHKEVKPQPGKKGNQKRSRQSQFAQKNWRAMKGVNSLRTESPRDANSTGSGTIHNKGPGAPERNEAKPRKNPPSQTRVTSTFELRGVREMSPQESNGHEEEGRRTI